MLVDHQLSKRTGSSNRSHLEFPGPTMLWQISFSDGQGSIVFDKLTQALVPRVPADFDVALVIGTSDAARLLAVSSEQSSRPPHGPSN